MCRPRIRYTSLSVIPGSRRYWRDPESKNIANLDAGFLRHDEMMRSDLFCKLLDHDISCRFRVAASGIRSMSLL